MVAGADCGRMLDATLTATVGEAGVDLSLTVENAGEDAVALLFRDGQRAEYVAERADTGEEVWRYSDGRMFTMALDQSELAPGEATTYEATWQDPPAGDYRIRAWVTAADVEAHGEATVTVP